MPCTRERPRSLVRSLQNRCLASHSYAGSIDIMAERRFRIINCRTSGVDAVWADTAHAFGRHTHDQFGIGLMLRGAQKSFSGRGIVEAQAGDIISVNPGEVHDGIPLDENGRAWRMLYFEPSVLAVPIGALTNISSGRSEFSRPAMRDSAAAKCFVSLFRAMTDPFGGDSEIEQEENLLLLLGRLVDRRDPKSQRRLPKTIDQVRERIDDDPSAPLSLNELAAIGGISQFQLVRGFSKATGLTPHAYLIQRRLQSARKMIARGVGLADAAQASGFADQSHMTRLFVRTYGMSPGLYAAAGH